MTTTSTNHESLPVPSVITIGGDRYAVRASGFCPALDAWIVRNASGRLVTIPA